MVPTATSAASLATTSPIAAPSSGASRANGGTYDLTSFIRPRMYGSTDMYWLRTTIWPGPGVGTSVSTSRKVSSVGQP